jgi:hypothetical protein
MLIFPGDYLVLTKNGNKVKNIYGNNCQNCFLNIQDMPELNSTDGQVIIRNKEGNIINNIKYDEEMHFPLIENKKGVSLERITLSDNINWHSAAATVGFATPGQKNSQSISLAGKKSEFFLSTEIFSPDNDGYQDVLAIHFKSADPGTVLSLNVFNENGLPVRTIISNSTMGSEGELFWDGVNEEGSIASAGRYVILAKTFDLKGNTSVFKKGVFLIRKV